MSLLTLRFQSDYLITISSVKHILSFIDRKMEVPLALGNTSVDDKLVPGCQTPQ
jgi:hypothetical protein